MFQYSLESTRRIAYPNGITLNSNVPCLQTKEDLCLDLGFDGICQYPDLDKNPELKTQQNHLSSRKCHQ